MKNLFLLISAVSINLMAYGQCQANFTSSMNGATVAFTNTSVGSNVWYSWSFGDGGSSTLSNPNHTYASTGLYNVCLTIYALDSLSNCQQNFCDSLYVMADSTSSSCDAGASFDVNLNGTITGTATSPNAYSFYWSVFDNSGTTLLYDTWTNPMSYNPGSPGVYLVCLTTWDSLQMLCDSACYTVATDSTAGLNSLEQITLNVYPNPANDFININTSEGNISTITLLNISGTIVREAVVREAITQIELQNLPQGMYFVHALGREGQQLSSCKIIKR
jgi:PKD repeat protein